MTHLESVAAGTRIRSVELKLTFELNNRVKELPFRVWKEEGRMG